MNREQYFIPKTTTPLGAETLSAAAAVHGGMICVKRCKVKRILFAVTTQVDADATAPVVEFNRRPTLGSSSGEVALGTLTLPDGTGVGKVVYKDIEPVVFNPGEELSFEHTVQAADGTSAAGVGHYAIEAEDYPEEAGNETNMVASV